MVLWHLIRAVSPSRAIVPATNKCMFRRVRPAALTAQVRVMLTRSRQRCHQVTKDPSNLISDQVRVQASKVSRIT